MSPLGFDAQQMFRFLAVRFRGTHLHVQQQTLNWLQLLSSLHIVVPIDLLVNIFQEGVNTSKLDDDMSNLGPSQMTRVPFNAFLSTEFIFRHGGDTPAISSLQSKRSVYRYSAKSSGKESSLSRFNAGYTAGTAGSSRRAQ